MSIKNSSRLLVFKLKIIRNNFFYIWVVVENLIEQLLLKFDKKSARALTGSFRDLSIALYLRHRRLQICEYTSHLLPHMSYISRSSLASSRINYYDRSVESALPLNVRRAFSYVWCTICMIFNALTFQKREREREKE